MKFFSDMRLSNKILLASLLLVGLALGVILVIIQNTTAQKSRSDMRAMSDLMVSSLNFAITPLGASGSMHNIQRIFENIGSRADSIVVDLVDPARTIMASSLLGRVGSAYDGPNLAPLFIDGKMLLHEEIDRYFFQIQPIHSTLYFPERNSDVAWSLSLRVNSLSYAHNVGGLFYQYRAAHFSAALHEYEVRL